MKKLWNSIKKWFLKLNKFADKVVPVAVKATQAIKKAIDSGKIDSIANIIKDFAPAWGDLLVDQVEKLLEKYIPKLALQLEIIEVVTDEEDPALQVKLVLEKISEGLPEEKRQKFLSQLAQQVAYDLADGKVTWGEAGAWVEIIYSELFKKN